MEAETLQTIGSTALFLGGYFSIVAILIGTLFGIERLCKKRREKREEELRGQYNKGVRVTGHEWAIVAIKQGFGYWDVDDKGGSTFTWNESPKKKDKK